MINHDMTFCINNKCKYKNECKRNINNNKFKENELIWQSEFELINGECNYFIKRKD